MFAPTALVVGLYREFFELNLVNTYLALILTNAAFNLAFAIWILHGFFSSIPPRDRGGGAAGRLRPVRHAVAGHAAADPARHRDRRDLHLHRRLERVRRRADPDAGRRPKPLTVGINSYVTGYEQNWDQLFAASLIAIVPVVILFALSRSTWSAASPQAP